MRVLPLIPKSIALAISVLQEGGIVIHPTETCYGLACDLTNPTAIARLFTLKKRPLDQPVSALFSSIEQAKQYVLWNSQAEALAKKYLPGPLTLILPLRTDAPHQLHPTPSRTSELGHRTENRLSESRSPNPEVRTLGIRISSYPFAQELVTRFGKPISTTSANLHGEPAAYNPQEIVSQFPEDSLTLLLISGGSLCVCPPSTVVNLTGPSPKEVRSGSCVWRSPVEHDHDPQ